MSLKLTDLYYQDISLIECNNQSMFNKLFKLVHYGLVNALSDSKSNIGITFPEYDMEHHTLGNVIRLIGSKPNLIIFSAFKSLTLLGDYITISDIVGVPDTTTFVRFKRIPEVNNSKLRRLASKKAVRENISYTDAIIQYKKALKFIKSPFITLPSDSTKQYFKLFIDKEFVDEYVDDGFSAYGLSSVSSLPWF